MFVWTDVPYLIFVIIIAPIAKDVCELLLGYSASTFRNQLLTWAQHIFYGTDIYQRDIKTSLHY